MNSKTLGALLVTASLASTATAADSITFEVIPGAANALDMTPDGRYIVGSLNAAGGAYLYDRVAGEMIPLPPGATGAVAVSDDASTVVGWITDTKTGAQAAGLWRTGMSTWMNLGLVDVCGSGSSPSEISGDGTTVVGLVWEGCDARGFRWTEEAGLQMLENLANGGNRATVVSADGSVIAGFAQGAASRTPATWDATTAGVLLDPPNGDVSGEVIGISDDGSTLLVEWDGVSVKIVDGGEPETIGFGTVYPGWSGNPTDIADDEGTIIGHDNIQLLYIAWIQPQGFGQQQDLELWIEQNGGDVPDDAWLETCQAISRNGRVIIGNTNFYGAWIVKIGSDCPADTNDDETVDVQDLVNVITAWGTDDANADVNDDGTVDVQDLVAVITAWGECN
ncbi:MAG: hypothetical protein ACYTGR_06355 [Planctomycetota bacterium]|jgi:hypothetical protein